MIKNLANIAKTIIDKLPFFSEGMAYAFATEKGIFAFKDDSMTIEHAVSALEQRKNNFFFILPDDDGIATAANNNDKSMITLAIPATLYAFVLDANYTALIGCLLSAMTRGSTRVEIKSVTLSTPATVLAMAKEVPINNRLPKYNIARITFVAKEIIPLQSAFECCDPCDCDLVPKPLIFYQKTVSL